MRLRTRLILTIVALVFALVAGISGYFIHRMEGQLKAASDEKVEAMRLELRSKGESLARNVALASERAVAVLDFLFLTEVVETTISHDPEVVYGTIMDKDRRALVDSRPGKVGTVLSEAPDVFASSQEHVTSQEIVADGAPVLDVSSPIIVNGQRWGTIRFGVSLKQLNQEIANSRVHAQAQIRSAVIASVVAALLLIVLGAMVGGWAASVIARPMQALVGSVNRITEGELEQHVEASGGAEFVQLAGAFNDMSNAIKKRDEVLHAKNNELQVALAAAHEANRLKSEFLANISHELRTPLNALINVPVSLLRQYRTFVLWHCSVCNTDYEAKVDQVGNEMSTIENCPQDGAEMKLERRVVCSGDPAEHQHFLGRMQQSAHHLLSVVNDLLDFSKLEAGKMILHPSKVETAGLLGELSETMAGLAGEKNITVEYENPSTPLVLTADTVKLMQIFINLIGNAIKFTPQNGRITVTAKKETMDGAAVALFSVADTGIGIPADQLDAVFESFRQVDGSHTRAHGGTGLGLAITKQLVTLHHGRIWATSTLGQGSQFVFFIPLEWTAVEPRTRRIDEDAKRVVVVDDNLIQLEVTRMILEGEGFAADLVADAQFAVERVRTLQPAFVILDVMMPQVSGVTVLRNLRADAETRDIPVLMATAYHSNRELVQEMGGIWLPKPWGAAELRKALSEQRGEK